MQHAIIDYPRWQRNRNPPPSVSYMILPKRTLCVAPMLDWTDRHCRMFHRQITRHTWLYTEMVTTGALLHGDVERHLNFNEEEHPLALQLGGSEPADLAHCAKLGQQWGYDEINLNCGCPSERVQKGAFGACLMTESNLVADCVKAMRDAVSIDVTVKHRIGIDAVEISWALSPKQAAAPSSCMRAMPFLRGSARKKTAKFHRYAMKLHTS
jgi:tRNA-dihydrouridine synthase